MAGHTEQPVRGYSFEFKAGFWLVAAFTVVAFLLWVTLPDSHRAVDVLEKVWPPLLTEFAGMVFGKLG